ncbi:MAG: hypothetical protein JXP34_17395 [Planctomycetes bacterium]|nr:hypothetical protein [Planctomycetota bacterium]
MDLSTLARACLGGLGTQLWQSAILLAVIGLLAYALRNASARVRYALWILVLARLAIPPIASPWPGAGRMPAALEAPLSFLRAPAIPSFFAAAPSPKTLDPTAGAPGSASRDAPSAGAPAPSAAPAGISSGSALGIAEIAFLAWSAGVLFLLGALCGQAVRLRRMVRDANPAPAELQAAFDAIRRRLGIRRRVSLRIACGTPSPVAIGVLRPIVLLPDHLVVALDAADREAVFVHELVHVRRWDLAVHWLASLVRIVYFFHPVAWIACARIRVERELAADESALLGEGRDFMAYGKTLIKVASLAPRVAAAGATSLALSEAARDLKRRLLKIKDARIPRARWWPIAPAFASLLVLIAACAGPTGTGDATAPPDAPAADDRSDLEVLRDFADALATADRARLESYLEFQDDLDHEFFTTFVDLLAEAEADGAGPKAILTSHKRLPGGSLFGCFLIRAVRKPFLNGPTPLGLVFRREDGRWRTQWWSARSMVEARERPVEQIGRRAMAQRVISLRFGPVSREEAFAQEQARNEAFGALADPPYNLEMFRALKGHSQDVERWKAVADLPWPEFERMILGEEDEKFLPAPEDFVLAFYLEAREGSKPREIPLEDGSGSFAAEAFPCLFEQSVARADVGLDPMTKVPQITVEFTKGGGKLFERITSENIGRKVAIVVDGKVVSAPVVHGRVGERAVISGRFTQEEARLLADRLNAYRKKTRDFLSTIRSGRAEETGAGEKGSKSQSAETVP